jgi:hypothetical protein
MNFRELLRLTRLEVDGNLYQLLIFRIEERGGKNIDDIVIVRYPENQNENREKTMVNLNGKLARMF